MGLQVLLDSRLQFGDALEHTAANAVLGNQAEKAFDLMDPRGGGRGEVHVKARMPFEPGLNLGVLVGGVVVGDQVHGEVLRCFSIGRPARASPFGSVPISIGSTMTISDVAVELF
jgi:hypothetical protein